MCDMQNMPTQNDGSCEEDTEMNWNAAFSTMGGGTHFVTTGGQLPITKIQQSTNNGTQLSQVVGMVGGVNVGDGVQYVRAIDGSQLQATPQLISVPITLPGTKPGDPQPTVQIQVLAPSLIQQQQPKYHMQIPIQGFQQGAVLSVAYSPESNDNTGIQLLGNGLPDGLQVVAALPHDMQLMSDGKESLQQQMFLTQNQQIIINNMEDVKPNISMNNNEGDIIIKEEECDDDEDSQGADNINQRHEILMSHPDIVKYVYSLPTQQGQGLPVSLQQFLRLNPTEVKKNAEKMETEATTINETTSTNAADTDDIVSEDPRAKKKKKYKKKPSRPVQPKPGQVVIATAADGTPIYCCPECQNAYPEKEQLEMHLSVHQIERRFICGICGAGLKRKEHLERHKLGHNPERPYVCGVCGKGFKRREHLNLHVVIHSGVKSERCAECGKGFYRKDHLRKHTRSHETKRAKDEANGGGEVFEIVQEQPQVSISAGNTLMPEITIHVPTSANMQVPVQINIPQHVMTSLAAAQTRTGGNGTSGTNGANATASSGPSLVVPSGGICTESQLDALLSQHT